MKKKVVVGLSGGVDSAVAALRLKEEGHDLIGVFMKNWDDSDDPHCPAEEDSREARMVADTIGIPFYAFNFVKEYWDSVFTRFLDEYKQGHTPNPDILCNSEIKFKAFLHKALSLDVDYIATGHYARVRQNDQGDFELLKGVDPNKDQSYFLHAISQEALSKTLFPLGGMTKQDVRQYAMEKGLPNWDRKDSTGICFIGERDFKTFLSSYLGRKPGDICDLSGNVVGQHDGLMFHTIGQRQGLGIGGPGEPWYVVGKDTTRNVLFAAQGKNHPSLFGEGLVFSSLTTLSGKPLPQEGHYGVKIRYRQSDQSATVFACPSKGLFEVHFDEPQRAISPKQSVVFYKDEVCLGGGVIERAIKHLPTATN